MDNLLAGIRGSDGERVSIHLKKLLPHIDTKKCIFVGGIAIRYHAKVNGVDYPERPFNDIVDMIVSDPDAISPEVSKELLVYHYHPRGYFLVLLDPETSTKIDIFPDFPKPKSTLKVKFLNYELNLVSIEDQLVKTVLDIERVSEEIRVDHKQFRDAQILMQIADKKKAREIWKEHGFKDVAPNLDEAYIKAQKLAKEHPKWLKKYPFRKEKHYKGESCISKDGFEVAPMEKIYNILGYVE